VAGFHTRLSAFALLIALFGSTAGVPLAAAAEEILCPGCHEACGAPMSVEPCCEVAASPAVPAIRDARESGVAEPPAAGAPVLLPHGAFDLRASREHTAPLRGSPLNLLTLYAIFLN